MPNGETSAVSAARAANATAVSQAAVFLWRLKGEQIWLQWNGTEDDIAVDLVAAGVPKEHIVWGFQTPFMRQFTGYAVG